MVLNFSKCFYNDGLSQGIDLIYADMPTTIQFPLFQIRGIYLESEI